MPKPLDRRIRNREHDERRKRENPYRKWYDLAIWRGPSGLRQQQLARQPLCERHLAQGIRVRATTVNHRVPHKGTWQLFCDPANHESTCKPCHDQVIQAEERRGFAVGNDINGRPLDPNHPWNRNRKN